jgi:hypothetical protein
MLSPPRKVTSAPMVAPKTKDPNTRLLNVAVSDRCRRKTARATAATSKLPTIQISFTCTALLAIAESFPEITPDQQGEETVD